MAHFPNEINQKPSDFPIRNCNYKLPNFRLLSAFHTSFLSLVPQNQPLSLACAKIFSVSRFCCV